MIIIQFQVSSFDRDEYKQIPNFCNFIIQKMYAEIDNKLNRRKVQLRIKHLYNAPWIQWDRTKYIDVSLIFNSLKEAFIYKEYKNNIWKIEIDNKILIPNTKTPLVRLIRFLNYGDTKTQPMGIFTRIENKYRGGELMSLWRLFILNELGYISNTRIVTR